MSNNWRKLVLYIGLKLQFFKGCMYLLEVMVIGLIILQVDI